MKNKDKYSLDKLRISVTHTIVGITDIKIYHGIKCVYYKNYSVEEFTLRWITDFFNWLEEEYIPNILDDVEKAYLSAVIKPFRKDVKYIKKMDFVIRAKEYLLIKMRDLSTAGLPLFEKETMYKGMEVDKKYTLEELGL